MLRPSIIQIARTILILTIVTILINSNSNSNTNNDSDNHNRTTTAVRSQPRLGPPRPPAPPQRRGSSASACPRPRTALPSGEAGVPVIHRYPSTGLKIRQLRQLCPQTSQTSTQARQTDRRTGRQADGRTDRRGARWIDISLPHAIHTHHISSD